MPGLQIVGSRPLSGKSTVAAAIAQGLAREGHRVHIERAGTGEAAAADAASFGDFLFAASSGRPVSQPPSPANGETLIVEMDAGSSSDVMPAIIAVHGAPGSDDKALAETLGARLLGTIAVAVDPESVEDVARELTNSDMRPLALLPENWALSAPCVSELSTALEASVLHAGENEFEVVEHVLIAPVYADPARPHFRRFEATAVLSPFNKTDLHLAAIESEAACLVITGGKQPSPYVLDRALHGPTTVLLSARDTPATVASLGKVWSGNRFRGESKASAAYELLQSRLDFAGLVRKLES